MQSTYDWQDYRGFIFSRTSLQKTYSKVMVDLKTAEASANEELKIHRYNPKKINNFCLPTTILRKKVLANINYEIIGKIYEHLGDIEDKEYVVIKKFPFAGSEEDKQVHRDWAYKQMCDLYTRQESHMDWWLLDVGERYNTNISKIWGRERIREFMFRKRGEESLWITIYGTQIYEYPFRAKKEKATDIGYGYEDSSITIPKSILKKRKYHYLTPMYPPEEQGRRNQHFARDLENTYFPQEHTYCSKDIVRLKLPKALFDAEIFKNNMENTQFNGVPDQMIKMAIGMRVILLTDTEATPSMAEEPEMVAGTALAVMKLSQKSVVAKVLDWANEGKVVHIRDHTFFAECKELHFAMERRQFPIKVNREV